MKPGILQFSKSEDNFADDVPIALQVVAGDHGKGSEATVAATPQCGGEKAELGDWYVGFAHIVLDRWIFIRELPRAFMEEIASFCDGERDKVYVFMREAFNSGVRLFGC